MQEALQNPGSVESQTLGVIWQARLLDLVEGTHDLTPSLRIVAAPGESPGHQLVRIASEGQVIYCLGDLYHHPIEVEHPSWMAEWDDPPATLASRLALSQAALEARFKEELQQQCFLFFVSRGRLHHCSCLLKAQKNSY